MSAFSKFLFFTMIAIFAYDVHAVEARVGRLRDDRVDQPSPAGDRGFVQAPGDGARDVSAGVPGIVIQQTAGGGGQDVQGDRQGPFFQAHGSRDRRGRWKRFAHEHDTLARDIHARGLPAGLKLGPSLNMPAVALVRLPGRVLPGGPRQSESQGVFNLREQQRLFGRGLTGQKPFQKFLFRHVQASTS